MRKTESTRVKERLFLSLIAGKQQQQTDYYMAIFTQFLVLVYTYTHISPPIQAYTCRHTQISTSLFIFIEFYS